MPRRTPSRPIQVLEGDFSFEGFLAEIERKDEEFAALPAEEQARVVAENTRAMREFFAKNPGGSFAII